MNYLIMLFFCDRCSVRLVGRPLHRRCSPRAELCRRRATVPTDNQPSSEVRVIMCLGSCRRHAARQPCPLQPPARTIAHRHRRASYQPMMSTSPDSVRRHALPLMILLPNLSFYARGWCRRRTHPIWLLLLPLAAGCWLLLLLVAPDTCLAVLALAPRSGSSRAGFTWRGRVRTRGCGWRGDSRGTGRAASAESVECLCACAWCLRCLCARCLSVPGACVYLARFGSGIGTKPAASSGRRPKGRPDAPPRSQPHGAAVRAVVPPEFLLLGVQVHRVLRLRSLPLPQMGAGPRALQQLGAAAGKPTGLL